MTSSAGYTLPDGSSEVLVDQRPRQTLGEGTSAGWRSNQGSYAGAAWQAAAYQAPAYQAPAYQAPAQQAQGYMHAAGTSGPHVHSRAPQRLVLLAGLPGSGKTTLALQLQEQGWFWINQDTMGDRKTCKKACIRALRAGCDVVIDRCNFDHEQRGVWNRLAQDMRMGPRGFPVRTIALHLDIGLDECIRRVQARGDHPTLNGATAEGIIRRFAYDFCKLSRHEGFTEIYRAVDQHQIDNFARYVGPATLPAWSLPGQPAEFDAADAAPGGTAGDAGQGASNNAVPFSSKRLRLSPPQDGGPGPSGSGSSIDTRSTIPQPASQPDRQMGGSTTTRFVDDTLPADDRPFLLFDLNGTLTSHTAARRGAGENRMRPGIHHLRRLSKHFRLGIFSSASEKTVKTVLPMLEAAAGPGRSLFAFPQLTFTRRHTLDAPAHHVTSGGKPWDTVKPLHRYFRALDRVILVDDDAYKAVQGEEANMVVIPCWDGSDDDNCIGRLVDQLLGTLGPLPRDGDVRQLTGQVSKALSGTDAQQVVEQNPEVISLPDDPDAISLPAESAEDHSTVADGLPASSTPAGPAAQGNAEAPSLLMEGKPAQPSVSAEYSSAMVNLSRQQPNAMHPEPAAAQSTLSMGLRSTPALLLLSSMPQQQPEQRPTQTTAASLGTASDPCQQLLCAYGNCQQEGPDRDQ